MSSIDPFFEAQLSRELTPHRRCVFLSGLPGVGKSLVLQKLVAHARNQGRQVSILRWDRARLAFESPEILRLYPEREGLTHPVIRKAAGEWVRGAVRQWWETHPDSRCVLIGEAPLIGNRFSELARVIDDPAESVLSCPDTHFVVPVPTQHVRDAIERARARDIETPQHQQDVASALPSLVSAVWLEVARLAVAMRLRSEVTLRYEPELYADVYRRILNDRSHTAMTMDEILDVRGSVQEVGPIDSEILPSQTEVARAFAQVERRPIEEVISEVEEWASPWKGAAQSGGLDCQAR